MTEEVKREVVDVLAESLLDIVGIQTMVFEFVCRFFSTGLILIDGKSVMCMVCSEKTWNPFFFLPTPMVTNLFAFPFTKTYDEHSGTTKSTLLNIESLMFLYQIKM